MNQKTILVVESVGSTLYRFVKEDIILDTRTKDHMPVIRREIQED
jgi:hypothetical protein